MAKYIFTYSSENYLNLEVVQDDGWSNGYQKISWSLCLQSFITEFIHDHGKTLRESR